MFGYLASLEHRRESRTLRRLERASADEVQHHADERLAEMLLWCKARVPYYRQFLAGVPGARIRKQPAEVLQDLPVLNKSDLHEHFEALTAEDRPGVRIRRNATGGSTGETAQFLQDASYRRWNRAVLACFESWAGRRPGSKRMVLWGIPRDISSSARPAARFRNWLFRRETLNAYNMSEATMARFVARIRQTRPELLRVFTQSGAEFARFVLERGESPLPVGSVTCAGAMLLPEYRRRMEAAFGADVHDSYGSREVGPVAAEYSPGDGMLVSPTSHRLEILREDGTPTDPGEEGEFHITLLVNNVMPLLRYRIGDRGAWASDLPPADAPAWPRLGGVVGRTMEHVVAGDGTLRNSQLMSELVMHVGWIRRFQWVQDARDRIELRIEPHNGYPHMDELDRLETELVEEIRRILGPECRFVVNLCDRIASSPSGKYHYVVCKVH